MPSKIPNKKKGYYEIFPATDDEDQFCWRFIKNGKEIYRASETYKRRAGVNKSIAIAQGSKDCTVISLV